MPNNASTPHFLASLLAFASAFSLGCVISLGKGSDAGIHECGSAFANNDENCVCDPGYERCNPNDPGDTDCCEKTGKGSLECEPNSSLEGDECFCNEGYAWCTSDPDDLTCCVDPGQTSQGTGVTEGTTGDVPTTSEGTTEAVPTTSEGTTGGAPQECLEAVEPGPTCDPDTESFFCTNPESCGPYGSTHYICVEGVWVEDTSLEELCQFDGYDFAYGCVDTPEGVFIECGSGSGDACNTSEPSCLDEFIWSGCKWGKATEADCFHLCTNVGDDEGALYEYGSCEIQNGVAECACCDEGDEGCPINEDTTG